MPLQAVQGEGFQVGPGAGLTPVDTGDLTFTDQRIIFAGAHQSREWEYSALLGFHHADHPPWTAMAFQGQDQVSGFRYDEGQSGEIRFAIVLGLARFHNAVESLISDLQEQLDEFDRIHSNATSQVPAQQWQTQQAAAPPAQAPTPMGGAVPMGGAPMGTAPVPGMQGAGAFAAAVATGPATQEPPATWPPANPFGATPAQVQTPAASEVTWSGDPAQLAPSGDTTPSSPEQGSQADGATPTGTTTDSPVEESSTEETAALAKADHAGSDEPGSDQLSPGQLSPGQAEPKSAEPDTDSRDWHGGRRADGRDPRRVREPDRHLSGSPADGRPDPGVSGCPGLSSCPGLSRGPVLSGGTVVPTRPVLPGRPTRPADPADPARITGCGRYSSRLVPRPLARRTGQVVGRVLLDVLHLELRYTYSSFGASIGGPGASDIR